MSSEPSFNPVHGPLGVLAVTKCLSYVIHFLLGKLWLVVCHSGPVGNRNIGKSNLPFILERVLFNTPGIKVNGHAQGTPSIGHAQAPLPITLMHRMLGHMEHAHRKPVSEQVHRTPWNIYHIYAYL